jgi:hypothetical protein
MTAAARRRQRLLGRHRGAGSTAPASGPLRLDGPLYHEGTHVIANRLRARLLRAGAFKDLRYVRYPGPAVRTFRNWPRLVANYVTAGRGMVRADRNPGEFSGAH